MLRNISLTKRFTVKHLFEVLLADSFMSSELLIASTISFRRRIPTEAGGTRYFLTAVVFVGGIKIES